MAEPISHHKAHRGGYRAGSLAIGSESAKHSSYYPTPRVSTPGVARFYAPFCDFSRPSAANLDLSLTPARAAKHYSKSLRFLDTLPALSRKLSSPLPRRGDNELTNRVHRDASAPNGKTKYAWSSSLGHVGRSSARRTRPVRATPQQGMTKDYVAAKARNQHLPLIRFALWNTRYRATSRWSCTRGRSLLMGRCYRVGVVQNA